jgi:hypothetical protein
VTQDYGGRGGCRVKHGIWRRCITRTRQNFAGPNCKKVIKICSIFKRATGGGRAKNRSLSPPYLLVKDFFTPDNFKGRGGGWTKRLNVRTAKCDHKMKRVKSVPKTCNNLNEYVERA